MLALIPAAAHARWKSHRATPWLERLEPRALLSRTEPPLPAELPAGHMQGTAPTHAELLIQQSPHQHPLHETIDNRRVEKPPIFSALYTGPIQPDLAVVGAKGRSIDDGKAFVFTGRLLGAINSSQTSFYVFGVNRVVHPRLVRSPTAR